MSIELHLYTRTQVQNHVPTQEKQKDYLLYLLLKLVNYKKSCPMRKTRSELRKNVNLNSPEARVNRARKKYLPAGRQGGGAASPA